MHPANDYALEDTIVASAAAAGGLRGVVRLSGPGLWGVLQGLLAGGLPDSWTTHRSAFVEAAPLSVEEFGIIDAYVYVWPTSASYTRQRSAEVHISGAAPIVDAVIAAACRAGARMAGPGEFTLRAFLAGRLDLTQAESVLALVDARTRPQMETALSHLAGGLSSPLNRLRDQLLGLLAELEAGLDFVEEDIAFISADRALAEVQRCAAEAQRILLQLDQRAAAQTPSVVLYGAPNAGKSSLLNRLSEGTAALVSELAGTTRDYVERTVVWQGVTLRLVDTAGLTDQNGHALDALAQAAARRQVEQASLRLLCVDVTTLTTQGKEHEAPGDQAQLQVWTKVDLARRTPFRVGLATSSRTGEGLDALKQVVVDRLNQDLCSAALAESNSRCRNALQRALHSLQAAGEIVSNQAGDELAASELRVALDALGQVVGAVHTDDLLDQIFSRFCIGK